ncbi:hypothetical protein ACF3M1_05655 [Luteimonas sp. WGS1318]|uniref:hypothetical protein n=1 Tax=Luteimonas sp. WGS1318 TaxID=3366815 RepID=UPI00372D0479
MTVWRIGIVRRSSAVGALNVIASSSLCITSSPLIPRITAPRIRPAACSTGYMEPWVSPFSTARPTSAMGQIATRTG